MKVEPYLLLGGGELANSLRTLTYLRRGLAGAGFDVTLQSPFVVAEGGGYSDTYDDDYAYYLDSYRTQNLGCYCRTFDTGPYQSPAEDGAPWYDAARPESADFLGMLAEVTLQPAARRAVTARVGGGGSMGALSLAPRLVQVEGVMYASSRAGMAYGERWLARALTGSDGCGEDDLVLLPACPPGAVDADETYLRTLAGAGVVDGPVHAPVTTGMRDCIAQTVAFQLVAADPYLRASTELLDEPLDGTAQCADLTAPESVADSALVLTLTAGASGVDGVTVTATVDGQDSFYELVDVPADTTLVIDSSRRTVEATDADGAVVAGLDLVDFDGVFSWTVAAPGTTIEVCVDSAAGTYGPDANLRLEQIDREL